MKRAMIFLAAIAVAGCTRTVYVPVETKTTVTEIVRDTVVEVQLPDEIVSQVVPDTVSVVETSIARSVATWHGEAGRLEHMIENKADAVPVRVKYIDRSVEVEKPVPYPVYVDRNVEVPTRMPLRWWERVVMDVGKICMLVLIYKSLKKAA